MILDKVDLLVLHVVEGGQRHTRQYGQGELRPGGPLKVNGYVTGVVVLCHGEIEADLDGKLMKRIQANHDAKLTCKDSGAGTAVGSSYPYIPPGTRTGGTEKTPSTPGAGKYRFGGYAYFPRIVGTGVSREDQFFISLKKDTVSVRIPVQQLGCRTIFTSPGAQEHVTFQYQGTSLADCFAEEADLQQRLRAVSEGIRGWKAGSARS